MSDDNPSAPVNTAFGASADISEALGLGPDELLDWLEDHDLSELSEDDLARLRNYVSAAQQTDARFGPVLEVINAAGIEGPEAGEETLQEVTGEIEEQEEAAVEEVAEADFDTSVDSASEWLTNQIANAHRNNRYLSATDIAELAESRMPADIPAHQQQQWIARVTTEGMGQAEDRIAESIEAEGTDPEAARVLAQDFLAQTGLESDVPSWMLEANGGQWTDLQKDRLLDYYNDVYGTHGRYRSWEDLAPVFEEMTADNELLVKAALADVEPTRAMQISIPDRGQPHQVMMNGRLVTVQGSTRNRNISISEEETEFLQSRGFDLPAVTRLVRIGGMYGLPGQDDMADGDRVAYLTALVLATQGPLVAQDLAEQQEVQNEITALEDELGLDPGEWGRMTYAERQEVMADLRNTPFTPDTPSEARVFQNRQRAGRLGHLEALYQGLGMMEEKTALPGILGAQQAFNAGMTLYNQSALLSLIHAVDAPLAARIAASGGDPDKLDPLDNARALRILDRAGVAERDPWSEDNILGGLQGYFGRGGGGGGGAGPVRRVIDPVMVKENLTAMFQGLMLDAPSDALVNSFTTELQGKLDAAPEGMNFDVGARITEFLKTLPQYQELYGKKPASVSEEQYQAQFAAAQASMLGAEATSNDAVRQGMREGVYQTTVGAAAASSEAWNNSTFLGRLARAAQVIDEMT